MRRWVGWVVLALLVAGAVHLGIILATPRAIMGVAMKRLSGQGRAVNVWVYGARTTPEARRVVRPSPDLAYASCVFDLSRGPVRVRVPRASSYMSVSVYQADSDNVFVVDDRAASSGVDFILARPGQATPPGSAVVRSPSPRGIVLDRRLAPTPGAFAQVDRERRGGTCAPVR